MARSTERPEGPAPCRREKPGEKERTPEDPRRKDERDTLSALLIERLETPARDVPYAAPLIEKLGQDPETATLGQIVVDMLCMYAIKGNPAVIRSLLERSDGRPHDAEAFEEDEPLRIFLPLCGLEPAERK